MKRLGMFDMWYCWEAVRGTLIVPVDWFDPEPLRQQLTDD